MSTNKKSQVEIVIEHLEAKGSITSMEAFSKYKITRLAAIIALAKKRGYSITTELILNSDRIGHYAKYHLMKGVKDANL